MRRAREIHARAPWGPLTPCRSPRRRAGRALKLRVYEVDGLPAMDEGLFGGKCDPYASVAFAGHAVKGRHKVGQAVNLMTELIVPVTEPTMSNAVRLSLYDYDKGSSDDRIATVTLDYASLKAGPFGPRWVNLYGAPEGKQRGVGSRMNRGYLEGSWFRGRALVHMLVEDSAGDPKPEALDAPALAPALVPPLENYVIQLDLYEGSEIPRPEVAVWVRFGEFKFESRVVDVKVRFTLFPSRATPVLTHPLRTPCATAERARALVRRGEEREGVAHVHLPQGPRAGAPGLRVSGAQEEGPLIHHLRGRRTRRARLEG